MFILEFRAKEIESRSNDVDINNLELELINEHTEIAVILENNSGEREGVQQLLDPIVGTIYEKYKLIEDNFS